MSVVNFDGDGYADTTGLVYGFDDDDTDDIEIRKVIRSGYGHLGVSPGDVELMSSTKSTLTERLPALDLPGDMGYAHPDCGMDIPAWACKDCASPLYIGRTCKNPSYECCWAAGVQHQNYTGLADFLSWTGTVKIDLNTSYCILKIPSYIYPSNTYLCTMPEQEPITFSKKVDESGRLVVPQEIRQALEIDGREALVEFDAAKITDLDGGEDE